MAAANIAASYMIATGENEFTCWGGPDPFTTHAVDVLNCDTTLVGRISETRNIANLASGIHLNVSRHVNLHMAANLLASLPNALIIETGLAVESHFNLAISLFYAKDGFIEAQDKPGPGIDPDPEFVKKFKFSSGRNER